VSSSVKVYYPGAVLQSVCHDVPMRTASSKLSVAISRLPSHVVLSTLNVVARKNFKLCNFCVVLAIFSKNVINIVVSVLLYPFLCLYRSGMCLVNRDPIACLFLVRVTVRHRCSDINNQLDAKITNFVDNYNQLNMFRAIISPILRSTRLCLQLVV